MAVDIRLRGQAQCCHTHRYLYNWRETRALRNTSYFTVLLFRTSAEITMEAESAANDVYENGTTTVTCSVTTLTCPVFECGKSFAFKSGLSRHIKDKHSDSENQSCSVCKKRFVFCIAFQYIILY